MKLYRLEVLACAAMAMAAFVQCDSEGVSPVIPPGQPDAAIDAGDSSDAGHAGDSGDAGHADDAGDSGDAKQPPSTAVVAREPVTTAATLRAVAVDFYTGLVVAGGDGVLIRREGLAKGPPNWTPVADAPSGSVRELSVADTRLCVANEAGEVRCSQGSDPLQKLTGNGGPLVWIRTPPPHPQSNGFAVGEDGRTWQITESQKLEPLGSDPTPFSPVHGATDSLHGWYAVGDRGALAMMRNARWSTVDSGSTHTLRAAAALGDVAWAVGDNGTIVTSRRPGSAWQQDESPTKETLRATAGCRGRSARLAVGDHGAIVLVTDDGPFLLVPSGTDATLLSAACENDMHFVVVGEGGTILRVDP